MEALKSYGITGLIIVLWWLNMWFFWRILKNYKSDMDEQRRMYANNVKLVESNDQLARDLKDVVIMNTQVMTKLVESINTNQYCPQVRLEKQARGKQGG